MSDKLHQEIKAKMTQNERRLERELNAAGALCSAQWTKIKRLERQQLKLEDRIAILEEQAKERT